MMEGGGFGEIDLAAQEGGMLGDAVPRLGGGDEIVLDRLVEAGEEIIVVGALIQIGFHILREGPGIQRRGGGQLQGGAGLDVNLHAGFLIVEFLDALGSAGSLGVIKGDIIEAHDVVPFMRRIFAGYRQINPYYNRIIAYRPCCANGFFYRLSSVRGKILRFFSIRTGKTANISGTRPMEAQNPEMLTV